MPGMGLGGTATGAATGAAVGGPPGAVVGAAAGLAGDVIGYFGGKGAASSQERMAQQALQYQREIEAQRRREHEETQRLAQERQRVLDERREPYRQASLQVLSNWGYGSPAQSLTPKTATSSNGTLGALMGRG